MKILKRLLAIILTILGICLMPLIFMLSLVAYIFIGEKGFELMAIPLFLLFNPMYKK